MKKRYGRGFTLEELKEAGIPAKLAPTIGIAVDHRRKNLSLEGLQENVGRLKAYKSNLILFPRNPKKPGKADASAEDRGTAQQVRGPVLPYKKAAPQLEFTDITQEMKDFAAYRTLRQEWTNKRLTGSRLKKRAEEEAAEKDKLK